MKRIRFFLSIVAFVFSFEANANPGAQNGANLLGGCNCHGGVSAGDTINISFDQIDADQIYPITVRFPSTPGGAGENTFLFEVRDQNFQRVGELVAGAADPTPLDDVTEDDTYIRKAQIVEVLPSNTTSRIYFWMAPNNSSLPEQITIYAQTFDSNGNGTTGGDRHYFTQVNVAGVEPLPDDDDDDAPPFAGTDEDELGNRDGEDGFGEDGSSDENSAASSSESSSANQASLSESGGCSLMARGGQQGLDLVFVFMATLFLFLFLIGTGLRKLKEQQDEASRKPSGFQVATNA